MLPPLDSIFPTIVFNNVDFPVPLLPITPKTLPLYKSKDTVGNILLSYPISKFLTAKTLLPDDLETLKLVLKLDKSYLLVLLF